ncbi:MAG: winged helix-turn-helix domain-containing protein [Acidobacteriota bacterium]|nr:winged helix-turn-helix domain-containing protein [Acidobacteriota bacterium]
MATENLIATLEQSLRQTRAARTRLAARLAELEAEAETVRAELAEMDMLTSQTEAAVVRLLSSVLTPAPASPSLAPSDAEIEAAMRHDTTAAGFTQRGGVARHHIPPVRQEVEVKNERFFDRTIPQATTMILREEGGPLHVNEIYNRLLEGGFNFTGHNPTISIAVSLNRNGRFRKVAPGTFDLVMRDASQAS